MIDRPVIVHNVYVFFNNKPSISIYDESVFYMKKLIAAANSVLAKNTFHRLKFIKFVDPFKIDGSFTVKLKSRFDVYLDLTFIEENTCPRGWAGPIGDSGNGFIKFDWKTHTIINQGTFNNDFFSRLHFLLHEFGHLCGIGLGEFYSLYTIEDSTGVEPIVHVDGRLNYKQDIFWKHHEDWICDPMLINPYAHPSVGMPTNYNVVLSMIKFSKLSSGIMNSVPPNESAPLPNLQNIKIRVMSNNSNSIFVKVWKIDNSNPVSTLIHNVEIVSNGYTTFSWDKIVNENIYSDNVRLIKVFQTGKQPVVKYITIFDAQEYALYSMDNEWTHTFIL